MYLKKVIEGAKKTYDKIIGIVNNVDASYKKIVSARRRNSILALIAIGVIVATLLVIPAVLLSLVALDLLPYAAISFYAAGLLSGAGLLMGGAITFILARATMKLASNIAGFIYHDLEGRAVVDPSIDFVKKNANKFYEKLDFASDFFVDGIKKATDNIKDILSGVGSIFSLNHTFKDKGMITKGREFFRKIDSDDNDTDDNYTKEKENLSSKLNRHLDDFAHDRGDFDPKNFKEESESGHDEFEIDDSDDSSHSSVVKFSSSSSLHQYFGIKEKIEIEKVNDTTGAGSNTKRFSLDPQ